MTTKPTKRYLLAVVPEITRSDLRDDGGELHARAVVIDTESPEHTDTSSGDYVSFWQLPDDLRRFDGFRITSWFYVSSGAFYGSRPTFEAGSYCDLEDVERMRNVLKPIEAKLAKMHQERGPCSDLAEWFGRACEASGVSVVLRKPKEGREWPSGYRYHSSSVGSYVAVLRDELAAVREYSLSAQ